MARTQFFLLNSVGHAFRFHQGPEFLICRDWVRMQDIAAEGLQSAENQV